MKRIDLTGKKIGRLTVIELDRVKYSTSPAGTRQAKVFWKCICECGREVVKSSIFVRKSKNPSCGCWTSERASEIAKENGTKHGYTKEHTYTLFLSARGRAKKRGIPFDLDYSELEWPTECPVLGIPIFKGKAGSSNDNSPSLDRFDNSKGYTKDNVRIISRRANTLKNDASLEELEKIVKYMKGEL